MHAARRCKADCTCNHGFRPWHAAIPSAIALYLLSGFRSLTTQSLHADIPSLPAVPFALPEDVWFVTTRQELPERSPGIQSRAPTALAFPDLPPSSLLSLCEPVGANSSISEPRLWPTLTLESLPSYARIDTTRHGTHPGPVLTVVLPVLAAAVLLTAAAAVFIGLNTTMQRRPRIFRNQKAVVCTFSRISVDSPWFIRAKYRHAARSCD